MSMIAKSQVKIGFPDIPFAYVDSDASTSLSSTNEDSAYPHRNLYFGGRSLLWKGSLNTTNVYFRVDLGSDSTKWKSADFVYFGGLNLATALDPGAINLAFFSSTDNFSSVTKAWGPGASDLSTSDLYNNYTDYIYTFPESPKYRYWAALMSWDNNNYMFLRNLMFGKLFDFCDRSPIYPFLNNYVDSSALFRSTAGSVFVSSNGNRQRNIQLTWNGLTIETKKDFQNKIGQHIKRFPVILYEATNADHKPLEESKTKFGWIQNVDWSVGSWKGTHRVTIDFLEDVA